MSNDTKKTDNIKVFSRYLATISPFEFTTVATILGYVFSIGLSVREQNALGNWFELIGQIMLTFASHSSASPSNDDYQKLLADIEALKKEIDDLKNSS